MPIIIPKGIPAFKTLEQENIFVMDKERAVRQDIRPIEIAVLNLMPTKIETETQLIRLLSNSPLQINLTLLKTETYESRNVGKEHLEKFYKNFSDVRHRNFDGMIITGAPVETMEFEDVGYYKELTDILDFAKSNVTSTLFICWGAQVALYYYHGIGKNNLRKKLSGIYEHYKTVQFDPLLKGVDDKFFIPHSRYTEVNQKGLKEHKALRVLAESKKAGVAIAKSADDKNFFLFGHSEYDADTLNKEYIRDKDKGINPEKPFNYFDKDGGISVTWRGAATLIFSNWLNYYVYQVTPYDIGNRE